MPQFDFFSFSEQVIAFLIAFLIIYFLYLRFILVTLAKVTKMRSKIQEMNLLYTLKKFNSDVVIFVKALF